MMQSFIEDVPAASPLPCPAPPARRRMPRLSRRETQVLAGLLLGEATKQMAEKLGISANTVKDAMKALYRKLEVHSSKEIPQALIDRACPGETIWSLIERARKERSSHG